MTAEETRALVLLGDEVGWAGARVAEPLAERAVVAPHFALRPLLRALSGPRRFRVIDDLVSLVLRRAGEVRIVERGGICCAELR